MTLCCFVVSIEANRKPSCSGNSWSCILNCVAELNLLNITCHCSIYYLHFFLFFIYLLFKKKPIFSVLPPTGQGRELHVSQPGFARKFKLLILNCCFYSVSAEAKFLFSFPVMFFWYYSIKILTIMV